MKSPTKLFFLLSLSCLTIFIFAQSAFAVDFINFFGGLPGDNSFDVSSRYVPLPHPDQSDGTPQLIENRLRGQYLISKNGPDTWTATGRASQFNLSSSPVIEPSGVQVPEELWDVEVGGMVRRKWEERRQGSVSATVGSASDKLFHSFQETTVRLTGTYSIPSQSYNAWLFSLSYSNNRYFANNIPLPGVSYYVHAPTAHMDALVGFPFIALFWKPTEDWTGRLFMFGPRSISAEMAHAVRGPIKVYGGFDWAQPSWLRADRTNRYDRLIYDSKKWILGLRAPVSKSLSLDFSGGYEFGRRFFEDKSALAKDVDQVNLDSGLFLQTKFIVRL